MTMEKPASFFIPTLTFSINMMEAEDKQKLKGIFILAGIGVYQPAEVFNEDDVWSTHP